MKVKDVMVADSVQFCDAETKLTKAVQMMKDSNRGALPVVDKKKIVVGIITDRDVCLSVATANGKNLSDTTVQEILPKNKPHTLKADAEITDALFEMRKNKIGRLPVTDSEGRLQGMLSINNILSHAIDNNEPMGELKSKEENIAKTVKALFDRNNGQDLKTKNKEPEFEAGDE